MKSIHIPYLPPIKNPGWLSRYVVGPYDKEYFEIISGDITAGIIVGLILIPQALAYSLLAGLPPANGLYTAILSLLAYMILGTSSQLNVGPATLISLLTSQLVAKYANNISDVDEIMDIAGQACCTSGLILITFGSLNMGKCFNIILSQPVLSGFTTGAAFNAGLAQLPGIGMQQGDYFSKVPKLGQQGYEYNYQIMIWYINNWYRPVDIIDLQNSSHNVDYMLGWSRFNPFSIRIFCGVYIPLLSLLIIYERLKFSPQLKNSSWYRIFTLFYPLISLVLICISGKVAADLMRASNIQETTYHGFMQRNINVVGKVPMGLNFFRIPIFRVDFFKMIVDILPIVFITFMESYASAKNIAKQRNELKNLNSSQELFAVGVCNALASISSGFPVCGSFTRTQLSHSLGGRTLLTSGICICVILIVIGSVADRLYYIPKAALSAFIFIAAYGLIHFSDFWDSFKLKKKDFFIMMVTFLATFVLNSPLGLGLGIAISLFIAIYDIVNGENNTPKVVTSNEDEGVEVIKIFSDHITFLTSDYIMRIINEILSRETKLASKGERQGIILDISNVNLIDITGARAIVEIAKEVRLIDLVFVVISSNPDVCKTLKMMRLENDASSYNINLDKYLNNSGLDINDITRQTSSRKSSDSDIIQHSLQCKDSKIYIDDDSTVYEYETRSDEIC